MDDGKALKEYRLEKTEKLFDAYKDCIEKIFEVVDKDLLQEKIDDEEDEKATEQRLLDAITKRRKSLDEVDSMLDKIEKLEKVFKNADVDSETPSGPIDRTKKAAQRRASL